MKLETSPSSKERVSALQRKLYLKAKHQPIFRFYSLYDKVYRSDVLQHAYDLVRQNRGSPGLDRETFETIEAGKGRGAYIQELQETLQAETYQAQPVKRVEIPKANGETRPLGIPCIKDRIVQMAVKLIIEPIFEADFSPHSYGFRPQRSAHHAMDDITTGLLKGHVQVIDADLSKYFDMIPHDKLLKTVAERISDGTLLSLIKQWLKVVVIKEERGKRTHVGGGKKGRKGTPQGGVISPLLANIYLNILDRIWERHKLAEKHKARLVRYADDMVILCARDTTVPYAILQTILGKLELQLNKEKTQIRDSREEKFGFLGFSIGSVKSKKSGKRFPMIEPSDKSMQAIKQKIKHYTRREMNPVPIEDIVGKLNQTVRGWSNYFRYGHSHRKMKKIKYYTEESLRLHLRYRHKINNRGAAYTRFPRRFIYDHLGLYIVPTTPAWKGAHA
ncbi:MAG: group II intron reverse transcriptase/maturase [Candidatus Marinimicrobia bacterium]|jgi:group II intron reverse transcriptase/maturase|nr:group II intron reverse transcriptase/maturase [Gammaproteobacteria bacterium]MBT5236313.1 group II intron reverse transcriptase/maturase [Candidatus Neomarinimicrobiota bacterium]MBT4548392.1 group II intron reverse transcriptase/maturase [Gammaproteobacteria bacterium]MBT6303653.1 group II intron reverse transcriptase/maturase [Candidatus Neomarinimicrobiota bacterium]MBT6880526.1 group II intron reverse transcriptase/maturase [Gammaproteobacteria bacterium]